MEVPSKPNRVTRIQHELKRRHLKVVRTERLPGGFAAVTFGGDALEGFRSDSFDDHVKLFFKNSFGMDANRDYTPKFHDVAKQELTIEFGLHGKGPGAAWAAQAAPGQGLEIGGPRSSLVIPEDCDWHLLAGDSSAFPAIRRRLAELPETARVTVIVLVADVAEPPVLEGKATVDLRIVASQGEWLDALRAFSPPSGDGFAWCAGEASLMRGARAILGDEKKLPRNSMRIAAYWKRGESSFHENLETPGEPRV